MNPVNKIIPIDPVIVDFAETFRFHNVVSLEQSVKVSKDSTNKNRILVKIPTEDMPIEDLLEILAMFNFPEDYVYAVSKWYEWSKYIIMSLDKERMVYRVYFERPINDNYVFDQPHESIYAIKWEQDNPDRVVKTQYYSVLTKDLDLVMDTVKACGVDALPDFVMRYLISRPAWNYSLAHDDGTKRLSISFPLPVNTIYLKDTDYVGLDEFNSYPIKHYQTGVDKDNNEFYTLYFTIHRDIPVTQI